MGRIVPEINISSVREIIFQNYRIIYRTKIDYVEIITVLHGSRLLRL
ncbi:MAG: type II toxin-antitoxin system RelE/ParE family toxin [Candidatus Lokiarchaeota archaeon]|nr:type II toxin-antitoxin system RelE/ParE family toxin [Candidatus Lokiarchaeota archaeon]